uniref:Uncharacterized protein n=1 Tax=Romanomermis culicivorax TaxID=13658 RepID=A0A915KLD8_ROMCU
MSLNLPVFLQSMLLAKSPVKMPKQAITDFKLDNKTGMAVESLIKDIAEESFTIKTKIPSQMDIIQIESEEENVSETNTTQQMQLTKTTTSATLLSKSLSSSQYHIDWDKGEENREKAILMKMILMKDLSETEDEDLKMVPP